MSAAVFGVSVAILAVAAAAGCDGSGSPAGPSDAPGPPVAPVTIRVTGQVVDGSDRPVAGARVVLAESVAAGRSEAVAVADDRGLYHLDVKGSRGVGWLEIGVQKDGFEPSRFNPTVSFRGGGETTIDLRIHEIVRVTAGEAATLAIRPDDPVCPLELDYWRCRRIRVLASSAGRLTARATAGAETSSQFMIHLPEPGQGHAIAPIESALVEAGSETVLELLHFGADGRSGTAMVQTRLDPP